MVLLALNQAYFPTYKWMYPILQTFTVGPEELAQRLRQMFSLPPLEGYEHFECERLPYLAK